MTVCQGYDDESELGEFMQFLQLNLINKHGVSDHRGEVLITPSQIESIRSFVRADHLLSHHEVGSVVTTKTGDKHCVSQHTDEIVDMLELLAEREEWVGAGRSANLANRSARAGFA